METLPRTREEFMAALSELDKPEEVTAWSITNRLLEAIWNRVYNRIVALAWQSRKYNELFESSMDFRRREFNRILQILYPDDEHYQLPDHMAVCVRDAQRRTDLLITPEGMVFPWPEMENERPSREKLHEAYHLSGGLLPGYNRGWKSLDGEKFDQFRRIQKWYVPLLNGGGDRDPFLADLDLDEKAEIELVGKVLFQSEMGGVSAKLNGPEAERAFVDRNKRGVDKRRVEQAFVNLFAQVSSIPVEENSSREKEQAHCIALINRALSNDAYFIGAQFQSLVAQVPKIIARAWDDPVYQSEYRGDDHEAKRVKLIDIDLPGNIAFHVSEEYSDITIDVRDSVIYRYATHKSDIGWRLCLPFIRMPDDDETASNIVFSEMIAGCASNPLYTNTY